MPRRCAHPKPHGAIEETSPWVDVYCQNMSLSKSDVTPWVETACWAPEMLAIVHQPRTGSTAVMSDQERLPSKR